jgi:hypothetical protein
VIGIWHLSVSGYTSGKIIIPIVASLQGFFQALSNRYATDENRLRRQFSSAKQPCYNIVYLIPKKATPEMNIENWGFAVYHPLQIDFSGGVSQHLIFPILIFTSTPIQKEAEHEKQRGHPDPIQPAYGRGHETGRQ